MDRDGNPNMFNMRRRKQFSQNVAPQYAVDRCSVVADEYVPYRFRSSAETSGLNGHNARERCQSFEKAQDNGRSVENQTCCPLGNGNSFKKDIRSDVEELDDLLSKLNPMAEEFIPASVVSYRQLGAASFPSDDSNYEMRFLECRNEHFDECLSDGQFRKRSCSSQNKRRSDCSRTTLTQQQDSIRRTVYVSDIDHQVTEEQLAALFITCGQVVDCRICGDPNSILRFAFIEFTDEGSARAALSLAGTMLGYYPVRVLPSKTAIAPVNPTFLPRSEDEREMCARTVYCTNIDRKVCQTDVKLFFESFCGEVSRLRLLGDYHHMTRIAFVEFVMAESAIAALNCSGALLGSLPIRVSPSKTPVRPRNARSLIQFKQSPEV